MDRARLRKSKEGFFSGSSCPVREDKDPDICMLHLASRHDWSILGLNGWHTETLPKQTICNSTSMRISILLRISRDSEKMPVNKTHTAVRTYQSVAEIIHYLNLLLDSDFLPFREEPIGECLCRIEIYPEESVLFSVYHHFSRHRVTVLNTRLMNILEYLARREEALRCKVR